MVDEVGGALTESEQAIFAASAQPFFLCAGALVPYKRLEVAVRAFGHLPSELWIAGEGPERARLESMAGGNVRFLGRVSDRVLWECFRRCKALIFPGIEDFGIIPVECLASGRPVIGVDAGGLRDTVVGVRPWGHSGSNIVAPEPSGVFIPKRLYGDPEGIVDAVRFFLHNEGLFSPELARRQARRFSYREFFSSWAAFASQIGVDPGVIPAAADSERGEMSLARVQGTRC